MLRNGWRAQSIEHGRNGRHSGDFAYGPITIDDWLAFVMRLTHFLQPRFERPGQFKIREYKLPAFDGDIELFEGPLCKVCIAMAGVL